jgi:RimJ/RimL family protein N-acetyltransferase
MEIHSKAKGVYLKTLLIRESGALAAVASDPRVASQVAGKGEFPYPYTIENARYLIKYAKAALAEGLEYHFGVYLEEGKKLIGMAGIYLIDRQQRAGRIGYWINPAYWGKNHAHEAASTLLEFAFGKLGLDSVYGVAFDSNLRSRTLLLRLGFKEGMRLNEGLSHDGKDAGCTVYTIRRGDWQT